MKNTTEPRLHPGTLITDKAVAAALGICRASVWNIAKTGSLTKVKLTAKTTRFKSDEVLALIENGVSQ